MKNTHPFSSRRWALCAGAAALACLSVGSFAQSADNWPQRPIKLIVGAPAGGSAAAYRCRLMPWPSIERH